MASRTRYVVIQLVKGPNWTPKLTPAVFMLQLRHMRGLLRMRRAGIMAVGGPVPNAREIRGLVVVPADREAEAVAALARDPAVQAGRLVVRVADQGPDLPGP